MTHNWLCNATKEHYARLALPRILSHGGNINNGPTTGQWRTSAGTQLAHECSTLVWKQRNLRLVGVTGTSTFTRSAVLTPGVLLPLLGVLSCRRSSHYPLSATTDVTNKSHSAFPLRVQASHRLVRLMRCRVFILMTVTLVTYCWPCMVKGTSFLQCRRRLQLPIHIQMSYKRGSYSHPRLEQSFNTIPMAKNGTLDQRCSKP